MTNRPIVYDDHAVQQMRARGIRRHEVRWLIAEGVDNPEYVGDTDQPLFARRGYLGRREARVLWRDDRTHYYVITVMWVE